MHLRSSKNNSFVSLNKVHKKTSLAISPLAKKVILKNVTVEDEATNEVIAETVDPKIDLVEMVKRYNKNLQFFKTMLILKSQMELDFERFEQVDTVEITNFETMSFVCPELKYWSAQF
jgi:hypothetical protein